MSIPTICGDSSTRSCARSPTRRKSFVVGPSTAKLEFVRQLHKHDRALDQKIVGLETVDHPIDAQLVAYVKKYSRVPEPRVR